MTKQIIIHTPVKDCIMYYQRIIYRWGTPNLATEDDNLLDR